MPKAQLPFYCVVSPAVEKIVGSHGSHIAVLALRAILRGGRGIEIAHQQVQYLGHDFAFSSRVTRNGDLVIELDIGMPALRDRVVLEEDLRRAQRSGRFASRYP